MVPYILTSNPLTDTTLTVGCAELLFAKTSNPLTQFYPPDFSYEDMFSRTLSARRVSNLNVSDNAKKS